MHELLPSESLPRIFQVTGPLRSAAFEKVDQLLLLLPARIPAAVWSKIPGGSRLKPLLSRTSGDSVPVLESRLANKRQTRVVAMRVDTEAAAFELLTRLGKLVAAASTEKSSSIGIAAPGFADDDAEKLLRLAVSAALAAAFSMPNFRQDDDRPRISQLRILGIDERIDFSREIADANGNNLARWLSALPPNMLDATKYADLARDLAKQNGWQYKRFDSAALTKLGAGAFLAVAQGNEDDSASIVRLRYRPQGAGDRAQLSLVGKGIIFDTGGNNLKPFQSMLNMHGDMQGSAVALGSLLALSELQAPYAIDCWLAITENRIGPRAYKSQDVVTAANGKTIQTIHTDAEGRMALADTLVFASRENPALIIDFATLTGACVNAVTRRYSGVFTNRADWHPHLRRNGVRCGERVWPFPIGREFLEDMESPVADLQQCAVSGFGDHILAASFLAEFVEGDVPWIHMDLSAAQRDDGLAHIPSRATGFGVRYTLELMLGDDFPAPTAG